MALNIGSQGFPLNISENDQKTLNDLIIKINRQRCCAFLGAGISFDAGYPPVQQLIESFKEVIIGDNLDSPETSTDNRFWDVIESYREIIGEEVYKRIVIQIYGPEGKLRYLPFHQKIILTPFQAYITTNFDCCLENAAMDNSKEIYFQYYPGLDVTKLRNNHICHLHGILVEENPGRYFNSLILSRRNYDQAYKIRKNLPNFLKTLFGTFSIVFIGYSMGDQELINIMNEKRKELELAAKDEMYLTLGKPRIPNHYIILHEKEKENEANIKNLGLIPIYYGGEDTRHNELQSILEYIRFGTDKTQLPKPIEYKEMFEG